jgi:hypothetical protein
MNSLPFTNNATGSYLDEFDRSIPPHSPTCEFQEDVDVLLGRRHLAVNIRQLLLSGRRVLRSVEEILLLFT